jgi:hypothetical protein
MSRRSRAAGAKLIPVDELERLLTQQRRRRAPARTPPAPPGLIATARPVVVGRIRSERAPGRTFAQIAFIG